MIATWPASPAIVSTRVDSSDYSSGCRKKLGHSLGHSIEPQTRGKGAMNCRKLAGGPKIRILVLPGFPVLGDNSVRASHQEWPCGRHVWQLEKPGMRIFGLHFFVRPLFGRLHRDTDDDRCCVTLIDLKYLWTREPTCEQCMALYTDPGCGSP